MTGSLELKRTRSAREQGQHPLKSQRRGPQSSERLTRSHKQRQTVGARSPHHHPKVMAFLLFLSSQPDPNGLWGTPAAAVDLKYLHLYWYAIGHHT